MDRLCWTIPILWMAFSCGPPEDGFYAFAVADPDRHTVLVQDDGFDLLTEALADKVIAAYLIYCDEKVEPPASPAPAAQSFEEAKRSFIDDMAQADESCFLAAGMYLHKSRSFERIAPFRERWNAALRSGSFMAQFPGRELDRARKVATVLDGEEKYIYHGTFTAGLIAVDNPRVQLVLIQKPLSSVQQLVSEYTCLDPTTFALDLQVLSDPEAQQAYVERPLTRLERDIDQVIDRHRVGFINQSFVTLGRATRERLQSDHDCPAVDLHKLLKLQNELLQRKEKHRKEAGLTAAQAHLTIQAAGNESALIDTLADSRECSGIKQDTLVVGAVDKDRMPTSFTNQGNCVDLYTFGQDLIVPAPDDFNHVVSGTSFSVPFLIRALTLDHSPEETRDQIRQSLLSELDVHRVYWDAGRFDQFAYRVAGLDQGNVLPLISSSQALYADPP